MNALRIYTHESESEYPCRPFDLSGKAQNRMVLGEGAALLLMKSAAACTSEELATAQALVRGIGFATETLSSPTSISGEGQCFQLSMKRALEFGGIQASDIDLIIAHAPGTIQGDQAEKNAISQIFDTYMPPVYSNKYMIGHTLGASGALSLVQALEIFRSQIYPLLPYMDQKAPEARPINRIMVNAAGFGGNACTIIIERMM